MAFLSHNLCDIPGYDHHIIVFFSRDIRIFNKHLEHGYAIGRLKSSFRKLYGRYGDIIKRYYTFIAQLGGRHEDLSHPENSCRPRAKPEGDMNFLGGTNLHVSRLTGQLIVYYTES